MLVVPTALLISNDNYLFMVMVASNKAVESLLIDTVATVTVTSSTNIDSIIVIVKTVIFATNSLCWIYTSEIIALLLMYNFFLHPGVYECMHGCVYVCKRMYVRVCVCRVGFGSISHFVCSSLPSYCIDRQFDCMQRWQLIDYSL